MTTFSVIEPTVSTQSQNGTGTQRWQQAVTKAAEEFQLYGDIEVEPALIQQAMDLVLAGRVILHEDGTATVTTGIHTYDIQGVCPCPHAEHRSQFCTHYIATILQRTAYDKLAAPTRAPHATLHAKGWDCTQAPSSCTLKWGTGGVEMILTLRDDNDEGLFERIGNVLPKIQARVEYEKAVRQAEREKRQAERQQNEPTGAQPANNSKAQRSEDNEHYCNDHDVPLKKHTKDGRSWYSHFDDDTEAWCRGT